MRWSTTIRQVIQLKALIVIPAHNEAEVVVPVVSNLRHTYPHFDFIVVNDGSSDATGNLCRVHDFPLLDLSVNLGLSGAVAAGMKYAYLHDYDAVIQFDADGQHRPEYLQPLLDALASGYDVVCGSRYLTRPKPTSARMIGGSLIAWAIRLTTGVKLTDPTSGFRAYGRRIVQKFATQINMTPEPDTISYLIKIGARVGEIQVIMDERQAGQSYLTPYASLKYMLRMGISIMLVQLFRQGSLEE